MNPLALFKQPSIQLPDNLQSSTEQNHSNVQTSPLNNVSEAISGSFFNRVSPEGKKRFIQDFSATTFLSVGAVVAGHYTQNMSNHVAIGFNAAAMLTATLGGAATGLRLKNAISQANQEGQIALP